MIVCVVCLWATSRGMVGLGRETDNLSDANPLNPLDLLKGLEFQN